MDAVENSASDISSEIIPNLIPPQLKFLMSNIKNMIVTPLQATNYAIWKSQVQKVFRANNLEGFLDGSSICLPKFLHSTEGNTTLNPAFQNWQSLDQNLAVALYSVISPSILPYVLFVDPCSDIWSTLSRRLQSSTRSHVIQLKNELRNLKMNELSMSDYLLQIKSKVDALAAAGSIVDLEDVILYTLNGLPSSYQAFKTFIRTNLQPMSLDDIYTLLCSEEINLRQEALQEMQSLQLSNHSMALKAYRGRSRGRSPAANRGRGARGAYGRNTPCNSPNS